MTGAAWSRINLNNFLAEISLLLLIAFAISMMKLMKIKNQKMYQKQDVNILNLMKRGH